MKSSLLTLVFVLALTTLCSCGKSNSQAASDSAQATKEELTVGNSALVEVNTLEKNLKHVKFTKDFDMINGQLITTITLVSSISNSSEIYEAKDSLDLYSTKLDQFIKDYPASKYSLTSREELETKLSLTKKMLANIHEALAQF
jgi:hypothetical protein